jgi:hypothetical protein
MKNKKYTPSILFSIFFVVVACGLAIVLFYLNGVIFEAYQSGIVSKPVAKLFTMYCIFSYFFNLVCAIFVKEHYEFTRRKKKQKRIRQ